MFSFLHPDTTRHALPTGRRRNWLQPTAQKATNGPSKMGHPGPSHTHHHAPCAQPLLDIKSCRSALVVLCLRRPFPPPIWPPPSCQRPLESSGTHGSCFFFVHFLCFSTWLPPACHCMLIECTRDCTTTPAGHECELRGSLQARTSSADQGGLVRVNECTLGHARPPLRP